MSARPCLAFGCEAPATLECTYGEHAPWARHYRSDAHRPPASWFVEVRPIAAQLELLGGAR